MIHMRQPRLLIVVALSAALLFTGCGKPEPIPGQSLGRWALPVRVEVVSDSYKWGTAATLSEKVGKPSSIVIRSVSVPISVSNSVKAGWFEPKATLTWGSDPTRTELCDSNGGLHNSLWFRPNGGNEVLTQVEFTCGLSSLGDPGSGAFVTVRVESENVR